MNKEHSGKKLAGIFLDELKCDVREYELEEIENQPSFKLNDDLLYIKNFFKYFEDTSTHYLNPPEVIVENEYIEKLAMSEVLINLKKNPDLDDAIFNSDFFEYYETIGLCPI